MGFALGKLMNINNKRGMTDALKPVLAVVVFLFIAVLLFSVSARLTTDQKTAHKEALIEYYNETEGQDLATATASAAADPSFEAVEDLQEEQNRMPGYIKTIIGIIIGALSMFVVFKYIWPYINAM